MSKFVSLGLFRQSTGLFQNESRTNTAKRTNHSRLWNADLYDDVMCANYVPMSRLAGSHLSCFVHWPETKNIKTNSLCKAVQECPTMFEALVARVKRTKHPSAYHGIALRALICIGFVWLATIGIGVGWFFGEQNMRQHQPLEVNSIGVSNRARHKRLRHRRPTISLTASKHPDAYRSPLLIFTCRRPKYLSQTLDDVLRLSDHCGFGCPIIVSEDGDHPKIADVVDEYQTKFEAHGIPLIHMQHRQAEKARKQDGSRPELAYQALAQHYGWALRKVFNGLKGMAVKPERVMILEEDIHVSIDFFRYMKATSKLLDEDPTLLAVSAYNDNGHMATDPHRVLRSDFFPGLGWMMTRKLWKNELEAKWPSGYWDDWLREPEQRKNRKILRPEISRTFHFGSKGGTSNNQFGQILNRVKLNTENINWQNEDLSVLQEDAYDASYTRLLANTSTASDIFDALSLVDSSDTRLEYEDLDDFKHFARMLHIMDDEKASIPRTAYKGVVEVKPNAEHTLFLTPPMEELRKSFPALK